MYAGHFAAGWRLRDGFQPLQRGPCWSDSCFLTFSSDRSCLQGSNARRSRRAFRASTGPTRSPRRWSGPLGSTVRAAWAGDGASDRRRGLLTLRLSLALVVHPADFSLVVACADSSWVRAMVAFCKRVGGLWSWRWSQRGSQLYHEAPARDADERGKCGTKHKERVIWVDPKCTQPPKAVPERGVRRRRRIATQSRVATSVPGQRNAGHGSDRRRHGREGDE